MARAKLKLVEPATNPARDALAEAIERNAAKESEIAGIRAAVERGAVVVRTIVGPGAHVAAGQVVIEQIVN